MTAAPVLSSGPDSGPLATPSTGSVAAWGLYLGVSWTWCIALFIPVILMADTGPGAWPILFVCNVAGAAALPFVIRDRAASLLFVARNRVACRAFSVVTMLCQGWVLGWAASRLPAAAAAIALAASGLLLSIGRSTARWQVAAGLVWAVSLLAFLAYVLASPQAHLGATLAEELAWHPRAWFALPLVLAGFALSPYLDLTFHHAVQSGSAAHPTARPAFAAVFPLVFGSMLLFSLAYRDELGPVMRGAGGMAAWWLWPVLAAIVLQLGFTAVLHGRQLAPRIARPAGIAAALAGVVAWFLGDLVMPTGMTLNEVAYRASLGFYGVLVPCWVWSSGFGVRRPGLRAGGLTAAALVTAAVPMLLMPTWLVLYPVAFGMMVLTRR